jgi:centromere/kinetochore protein ZW10
VPVFGDLVFGKAFVSKNPYHVAFEENVDFGEHTPIVKLLSRVFLDHCVPSSCSMDDFATVEKVSESLQKYNSGFEAFLFESGFISKSTILSDYGARYREKYHDKIRQSILARGRSILLDQDYHNTIEVGVNIYQIRKDNRPMYLNELHIEDNDMGVFLMDKSSISQVASNLLELVIETMDQAIECATTKRSLISPSLYRAARELIDLFRAIIPTAYSKEIASIPRTAAVFHNDCVYFTNKLLTLGVEYRDKFPQEENDKDSALKVICTFLDAVPIFRELADKSMNEMIDYQKTQLSELISPRINYIKESLGSNEGVIEWTEAETALTSGIYHLRHLSRAWKPVLSHDVYGRTMGSLVDTLYKLYLDKIIGAKDISEEATHFVSALFRDAVRSTSEFFGSPQDLVEATKEVSRYCSLYHKFTAVGKFMDMTLTDINMGLSDGTFQSVSSAELTALVVAAYSDTPKRRSLLQLLRSESNK